MKNLTQFKKIDEKDEAKKGKVTSSGIEWDNKDPITNQPIKTTPVFISY